MISERCSVVTLVSNPVPPDRNAQMRAKILLSNLQYIFQR